MRVVALVPGGIGDQILFFPTLDDLKRNYPDAQIDVVTEPRSKPAYKLSKSVNEVLTFDFQDRNSLADWGNLVGSLRDREYDAVIVLGQSWSLGLVLWLTGIPTRIGYQGSISKFLTQSFPQKTQQYLAASYHDLLQGFGIKSPCPELAVNVPKPDIDWADKEQLKLGVKETGYVLLHPGFCHGAGKAGRERIYPSASWVEIIKDIQEKQPDIPLVVVQSADDGEFVRPLKDAVPTIKVTFPSDLGKLAAMIAGANLMLCTDHAPMHLSVAVQTYTIALFGDGEPKQLLPQSDRFVGVKSSTGKITDIPAKTVLTKIWGG